VALEHFVEEVQVLGRDLTDKIQTLVHEGNVQRVVVRDRKGKTFAELPITIAAVGAIAAPLVAVIGTLSMMCARFTITIERISPSAKATPSDQETI
jgi:phage-related minor tail protein